MEVFNDYPFVLFFGECFFCHTVCAYRRRPSQGVTTTSPWDAFGQAFFFSVQTFTTVGYGHVSPRCFLASFIAAVEACLGC